LKVLIITRVWYPNHQALFSILEKFLHKKNISLTWWILYPIEDNRPWKIKIKKNNIRPKFLYFKKFNIFGRETVFRFKSIKHELQKINPTLIIASPWSEIALFQAKKWALLNKVPFIAWVMGPRVQSFGLISFIRMHFSHLFLKRFVLNSKFVFCYGRHVCNVVNQITNFPKNKMVNVKHSINNNIFYGQSTHNKNTNSQNSCVPAHVASCFTFGYLGQLIERKGVLTLLEALRGLIAEGQNARLYILGSGPLKNKICSSPLFQMKKIVFFKNISSEKMKCFFDSVDCMVIPSIFDDWSTVINESFCAKVPVIASDGAYAALDLVKNKKTGLIFSCGNTQALKNCMKYIIRNPNARKSMIEQSFSKIQKWDVVDSAQIWAKYIVKAIS